MSPRVKRGFSLRIGGGGKYKRQKKHVWIQSPGVMEVLNMTPDSFYDGGDYYLHPQNIKQKIALLKKGNIPMIDIGGESSRPGSEPTSEDVELKRVLPIIRYVRKQLKNILISIDTTKVGVARQALSHGVDLINDVSAGSASNGEMFRVAAAYEVPIILMHKKGQPKTMQQDPTYKNVLKEVMCSLQNAVEKAMSYGVQKEQIILDPGIGFGKNKEHNLYLIQNLKTIKQLGYPVIIGASMKQLIGDITGDVLADRLPGSIGLHLAAIQNGCDLVRVHHGSLMQKAILTYTSATTCHAAIH